MLQGRVVGYAVSSVKHPSMNGWKLLLIQPLSGAEKRSDGDPVLAIDALGAGAGDEVLISSDGKHTGSLIGTPATPVRWSVVGIIDN